MASVSAAAEWQLLYNRYYRKLELYSMLWGRNAVDLRRHRVACAPFGGPIAAIRDDSKIVQLYAESARRKLRIFNSAGKALSSVVWDRPGGRLVAMSWTDDHVLVCVVQDGTVHRYDVRAQLLPNFSLGPLCFEQGVVDCAFWGNGLVAVTEANLLFCVADFHDPKPCQLADPALADPPLCLAVIEPHLTMSGNPEVLVASADAVLVVDEDGVQRQAADLSPLQRIAVSRNGKYLACFTHDGRLLVLTSDFFTLVFEYACDSALPPDQLSWCGMDSVLLYWDDSETLLMVGPSGDPIRYLYDEPVILIPECDGVRILSNSTMEFLHRVPDSTVSIFQIGSMTPAALLYDALDHFDRRSAKADENLRLLRSSLPEAVQACIDAAGHEFDVGRQTTLLRAASYGQAFCCGQLQRDQFQEMCKILRVLNAVRSHEIGIPLSIQQYKLLTASVLIARLVNFHQHLLALRISEHLNLNQEVVVMSWACTKIDSSKDIHDEVLLQILTEKLKSCKGISFSAVAAHAESKERLKLAALLLDHEPRFSEKVPRLLSLKEDETALLKAIESGDADLIYMVLFDVMRKRSPLELFGMLNSRPLFRDLFVKYAQCYQHEFLKDFYLSTGQLDRVAYLLLKESLELGSNPMASKGTPLHGPRIKLIEKAQKLFLETKEYAFEAKAAEEHAKLLRSQHELEITTKQPVFVDTSVSDTIRTCIVLGYHKSAVKVKTDFKVPEKRWYWLKVFALAHIKDWDALEKFSKEKRPPTGYKPFVEACIDAGEKSEALKYIPKLLEPRERAEAYERLGMVKEAADAASESQDGELLGRLKLTFAQNAAAASIFDALRDRLSFQGVS